MTEDQLGKAETAIENLAEALEISEQEVVLILREGGGKVSNSQSIIKQ